RTISVSFFSTAVLLWRRLSSFPPVTSATFYSLSARGGLQTSAFAPSSFLLHNPALAGTKGKYPASARGGWTIMPSSKSSSSSSSKKGAEAVAKSIQDPKPAKESTDSSSKNQRKSSRKRDPVDYNEEHVVVQEEAGASETTKNKKPRRDTPKVFSERQQEPSRDSKGVLHFKDHPEFLPNLTPKEVLRAGSFGGGYFRPIHSSVTGEDYSDAHKEFPSDWFEGLDMKRMITSKTYRPDINTYGVKCGGSLEMWESSGWITPVDPYGAFQW
ncbi:hypothetical protein NGA_0037902, partial [Nannochloropsis gaditana CCMP526]|uniref:uncharacterized protein n=1 Tax=Nannochloropsis gaditana (strain CCMP526) TaxID=1093141 RepID=UPI00029F5EA6